MFKPAQSRVNIQILWWGLARSIPKRAVASGKTHAEPFFKIWLVQLLAAVQYRTLSSPC